VKIYTKKGDKGETSLFGGGPYPKDTDRIDAYGQVDELNSVIGGVLTELTDDDLKQRLLAVQKELFMVGAELATLKPSEKMIGGFIQERHVTALEERMDAWESLLKPLKNFVLPGGTKAAAWLHLSRTVCRRAERAVVKLSHSENLRPELVIYLNRLSDFLFVMARIVNLKSGVEDILWEGILK